MGEENPLLIPPEIGTEVAVNSAAPFRVGLHVHVTVNGPVAGVRMEMHPAIRVLPYLKVIFEAYVTVAVIRTDVRKSTDIVGLMRAKFIKELTSS